MKQSIVVTIDGDIDYIKDYLNEGVNQWIISSVDIDDVEYDSDNNIWKPEQDLLRRTKVDRKSVV